MVLAMVHVVLCWAGTISLMLEQESKKGKKGKKEKKNKHPSGVCF